MKVLTWYFGFRFVSRQCKSVWTVIKKFEEKKWPGTNELSIIFEGAGIGRQVPPKRGTWAICVRGGGRLIAISEPALFTSHSLLPLNGRVHMCVVRGCTVGWADFFYWNWFRLDRKILRLCRCLIIILGVCALQETLKREKNSNIKYIYLYWYRIGQS